MGRFVKRKEEGGNPSLKWSYRIDSLKTDDEDFIPAVAFRRLDLDGVLKSIITGLEVAQDKLEEEFDPDEVETYIFYTSEIERGLSNFNSKVAEFLEKSKASL